MASLNKTILIGRLGRAPELRYTQAGQPITNFTIATDESYTNQQGERIERAQWHRIVTFGRQAEPCANYLRKGSLVYVEGSLQTRKWQTQEGVDRYTTEIKAHRVQFLDPKGAQQEGSSPTQQRQKQPQPQSTHGEGPNPFPNSTASDMDDVPF